MLIKVFESVVIADKHPWRPHWSLSAGQIKKVPDDVGVRLIDRGQAREHIIVGKKVGIDVICEKEKQNNSDEKSSSKDRKIDSSSNKNKKSLKSKIPESLKKKIG